MYYKMYMTSQSNLCQLLNNIHDMGFLNGLIFDLTFANDFQKSRMKRAIKTSIVYQSTVMLAGFFTENNTYHIFFLILSLFWEQNVDKMYYCKNSFKASNMRNLSNIHTKENKYLEI